jgi:hypothetical protein
MLSPKEKARIQRTLNMLENARNNCADSGIRKVIDAWIEDAKKTLAADREIQKRYCRDSEFKPRSSRPTR